MPRLIWVFAEHTVHFVGFDMLRLKSSWDGWHLSSQTLQLDFSIIQYWFLEHIKTRSIKVLSHWPSYKPQSRYLCFNIHIPVVDAETKGIDYWNGVTRQFSVLFLRHLELGWLIWVLEYFLQTEPVIWWVQKVRQLGILTPDVLCDGCYKVWRPLLIAINVWLMALMSVT